jgi:hypothetical protein
MCGEGRGAQKLEMSKIVVVNVAVVAVVVVKSVSQSSR